MVLEKVLFSFLHLVLTVNVTVINSPDVNSILVVSNKPFRGSLRSGEVMLGGINGD